MQRPEPRSRTSGKETAGPEVEDLGQRVGANAEVGDFEEKSVQRPEPRSRTSGKETAGPGVEDLGQRVGANAEVGDFEKKSVQRPDRGRGPPAKRRPDLRSRTSGEELVRMPKSDTSRKVGAKAGVEVEDLRQRDGRT